MTRRDQTLEVMLGQPPREAPDQSRTPTTYGMSDIGCLRSNNQDQFLVARLERSVVLEQSGFPVEDGTRLSQTSPHMFMVADGMGGHEGGDVASAVTIDAMAHYAFTTMPWLDADDEQAAQDLVDGLAAAVGQAQERMLRIAARKHIDERLGSTLTMAYAVWPRLFLFHVGDSRAYLYRDGELTRLTRDHNLAEEMVERQVMTAEEARGSRFSSMLTNALGGGTGSVHVELHRVDLRAQDLILLCSDGLHGEVTDGDIAKKLCFVTNTQLVRPCVQSLVDAARRAGGRDNITAVLARF